MLAACRTMGSPRHRPPRCLSPRKELDPTSLTPALCKGVHAGSPSHGCGDMPWGHLEFTLGPNTRVLHCPFSPHSLVSLRQVLSCMEQEVLRYKGSQLPFTLITEQSVLKDLPSSPLPPLP